MERGSGGKFSVIAAAAVLTGLAGVAPAWAGSPEDARALKGASSDFALTELGWSLKPSESGIQTLAEFDWTLRDIDWNLTEDDRGLRDIEWTLTEFEWTLADLDWTLTDIDWQVAEVDWQAAGDSRDLTELTDLSWHLTDLEWSLTDLGWG